MALNEDKTNLVLENTVATFHKSRLDAEYRTATVQLRAMDVSLPFCYLTNELENIYNICIVIYKRVAHIDYSS